MTTAKTKRCIYCGEDSSTSHAHATASKCVSALKSRLEQIQHRLTRDNDRRRRLKEIAAQRDNLALAVRLYATRLESLTAVGAEAPADGTQGLAGVGEAYRRMLRLLAEIEPTIRAGLRDYEEVFEDAVTDPARTGRVAVVDPAEPTRFHGEAAAPRPERKAFS